MKFTLAIKLWHNWLVKKEPNTDYWIIKEEFWWYIDYADKKEKIVVPVWFRTNFWSIPRLLRIFFNPTKYISYLLHDLLYSKANQLYTRKQSDKILLEALHVEWAGFIEKTLVYIWVRIGGFLFFKQ